MYIQATRKAKGVKREWSAMPGNQGTSDGEVELKVSYMVKRSQGKSAIGSTNFKKRVFVLTPSRLSYFEGTLEVSGDGHY